MEHRFNTAVKRLADLEQAIFIYRQETEQQLARLKQQNETQAAQLTELAANYNTAIERFNEVANAVNTLAGRVTDIEKNYDPTIID